MNRYEEYADDVDLGALEGPGDEFVARLVEAGIKRVDGRNLWVASWEPLSFRQEFSRETYPFRQDDYSTDRITALTRDGKPMGDNTLFGKVRTAFKENIGVPLTRNDVFRPLIEGHIYRVQRIREPYASMDSLNEAAWAAYHKDFNDLNNDEKRDVRAHATKDKTSFAIVPVEMVDDYEAPADVRVVRYGFGNAAATPAFEPTLVQTALLQRVLNGKEEVEYLDAILESGREEINCEPFLGEAANGAKLTARMTHNGGGMVQRNNILLLKEEAATV